MALKFDITSTDRFFTNTDKLLRFSVKQSDETTAQDISGWALSWVLKRRATDTTALITKTTPAGISITDGPNGVCEIAVSDEDTVGLRAGLYVHELKRTDVGSETPLCSGTVELLQSKHL